MFISYSQGEFLNAETYANDAAVFIAEGKIQ